MNGLFFLIYILSVLRLPYIVFPYLLKLAIMVLLKSKFKVFWNSIVFQSIRILGDFINLLLSTLIIMSILPNFSRVIVNLFFVAEIIRLFCEKGIMIVFAVWQLFPHRLIANSFIQKNIFRKYSRYYILSDEERVRKSLSRLKAKARLFGMKQTLEKLRYVHAFQIVPDKFILRYGNVRNIMKGEVFVHASWSSSPDLLSGLALRRSPWIFDPRYLRRPFYYRSEANPLMTRFVLENITLCPLFGIYQFGHEIKSARYEIFYKFMRRIGLNCEQIVCANGMYSFDVLASFILGNKKNCESMKSESELLSQLYSEQKPFSSIEIAKKYHLPLIYVQEEIMPIILSASEQKKTNIC